METVMLIIAVPFIVLVPTAIIVYFAFFAWRRDQ